MLRHNNRPMAFLLGAQKSGTTSLATCLDQHPHIALSSPKEPEYFSTNIDLGEQWYDSLFKKPGARIRLDASTSYTLLPTDEREQETVHALVPTRIFSRFPDAQFIYILRDPVKRAWSAYWHEQIKGREQRSFREAIEEDPQYLGTSHYGERIQPFVDCFGAESIHFVDFEQLKTDPCQVAASCAQFLGIEAAAEAFRPLRKRNESRQENIAGKAVRMAVGSESRLQAISATARKILPRTAVTLLRGITSKRVPNMSIRDYRELSPLFRKDRNYLQGLTDLELCW